MWLRTRTIIHSFDAVQLIFVLTRSVLWELYSAQSSEILRGELVIHCWARSTLFYSLEPFWAPFFKIPCNKSTTTI